MDNRLMKIIGYFYVMCEALYHLNKGYATTREKRKLRQKKSAFETTGKFNCPGDSLFRIDYFGLFNIVSGF